MISTTSTEEKKRSFRITGMTCATCAMIVERALMKVDGVKFAAVNLATETAFVILEKDVPQVILEEAVKKAGYGVSYESREDFEVRRFLAFKRSVILAWSLTAPLMMLMFLHMAGHHMPWFSFIEVLASALVVFVAGRRTIKGAWIALTHFHANMDVLVFLGSVMSFLTALLAMAGLFEVSFGSVGAMIMSIHLTGRYIESRLRDRATKEIKSLLKLKAQEALLLTDDGSEITVPIEAVKEGSFVLVKPGERVPVDGEIVDGISSVDESMITGEPVPALKGPGDRLISGSLNLSGLLKVRVDRVGEDTFLSQMISLIQEAQGSKVPIQAFADRVTNVFVPVVVMLAVISSVLWAFNMDKWAGFLDMARQILPWVTKVDDPLSFGVFVFVTTIVIACPCALGLATPMALVTGTSKAMRHGLVIRNGEAIQTTKDIGIVMFDKTGTLTLGSPKVVDHNLADEAANIAGALESLSNHPLGKAISELKKFDVKIEEFEEIVGEGVKGKVDGRVYEVGRPADASVYEALLEKGYIVVEVKRDGFIVGYIAIFDPIREDSFEAVKCLKDMGIEVVLVTGDNEITAKTVAKALGIDEVHWGVRPEDKMSIVRDYQATGKKVMMTGDGMNDAAALKAADVGVAMGSGTDLAIDSADVVILQGGAAKVVSLIEISKETFRVIRQNLKWAFGYNVVAIPLAMSGLLHPIIAEGAMALSSISVIINSLRIK
ncbi:MAG TPA: cation-translocating P-type ATPase [Acetomicrobium flavidum]|uniref:heavy metal translocating P-type ATPase n=1 Tax=Acetomicrobium flavidum TaxID=49896 RepID=UPI002B842649|nr:cation-translocating P-type ATPase [Acetomicrobium flavidum]HOP88357.1 cation-translocating P-type ATPase [Acetomicrobium flavidum]HPP14843.1 cation-translocating P-type ATPase [Acetomicrobium flavidum]